MLGAALNLAIMFAILWLLVMLLAVVSPTVDGAAANALSIAMVIFFFVVLPTTLETLTRGRSVGKLATGIRIVRDDGGPIRLRHAFIRSLVGVGEIYLSVGSIALIASMVHPKGKRIGDMLAGTYAVRVRGGQRAMPPVIMPMELAGWAHTA